MLNCSKLLWCIGKAIVNKGMRALADCVPFGGLAFEVCAEIYKNYHEECQDEDIARGLPIDMEQLAQADPAEVNRQSHAIALALASDQPPPVQEALAGTLALVPAQIRRTFTRKDDPSGKTRPATFLVRSAEDLLPLLPPRPPRFKAGDPLPNDPKWTLQKRLDAGGFGEVWLAQHVALTNRKSAVKFFLDPKVQERLLKHEARVINQVMQIKNDHIVKLEEVDFHSTTPWLRYEFIDGGPLFAALPLPKNIERRALGATAVMLTLARTVGACHLLKPPVIHRDLKPANVLTELVNGKHRIKVTDFGISEMIAEQTLDQASPEMPHHASLATPTLVRASFSEMYASPQQRAGLDAAPTDDVYALGVMWFQLLKGDYFLPLGRDYREDLADLNLCKELINVLARCVADRAERRWPNAAALADQIQALPASLVEYAEATAGDLVKEVNLIQPPAPSAAPEPETSAERVSRPNTKGAAFQEDACALPHVIADKSQTILNDEQTFELVPEFPSPKPRQSFTNAFGMKFARVPAGHSWLGGGGGNPGRTPFSVNLDLWCGVYPVTQAEWQQVIGSNPSHFKGNPRFPVESVSWNDVQAFLQELNHRVRDDGYSYRLPTEQEWEYICRGGPIDHEQSKYNYYFAYSKTDCTPAPTNDLSYDRANFGGYLNRPNDVGAYLPNPLGIFEMYGNVWEWTALSEDSACVSRGGSFLNYSESCTASYPYRREPDTSSLNIGFRLLAVPSASQ